MKLSELNGVISSGSLQLWYIGPAAAVEPESESSGSFGSGLPDSGSSLASGGSVAAVAQGCSATVWRNRLLLDAGLVSSPGHEQVEHEQLPLVRQSGPY